MGECHTHSLGYRSGPFKAAADDALCITHIWSAPKLKVAMKWRRVEVQGVGVVSMSCSSAWTGGVTISCSGTARCSAGFAAKNVLEHSGKTRLDLRQSTRQDLFGTVMYQF